MTIEDREIMRYINQEASSPPEFFKMISNIFSLFGPEQTISFFAQYYNTYVAGQTVKQ